MMLRWRLKACPRCGGDSFIDRDMDGWYEQCLMCAHRRELRELNQFRKRLIRATATDDHPHAA